MKPTLKAIVSALLCASMLANLFSCTLVLKEDQKNPIGVTDEDAQENDKSEGKEENKRPNSGQYGEDEDNGWGEWGTVSDYEDETKRPGAGDSEMDDPWADLPWEDIPGEDPDGTTPNPDDPWSEGPGGSEIESIPPTDDPDRDPILNGGTLIEVNSDTWREEYDEIIPTDAKMPTGYVRDESLIAWFDGNNNNNGSFSHTADLWKDLSGNANHIDISDSVSKGHISWEQGAMVIHEGGCYLGLPPAVVSALEGDAYTIEIVFGALDYTATDYITLISSPNDEMSAFIRVSGEYAPGQPNYAKMEFKNQDANGDMNRPYLYDAWNQINGSTWAVTSDLSAFDGVRDIGYDPDQDGNVHMYADGRQIAKGESEYPMTLDYVYLGNTAVNRAWSGRIHAIRVYNRALSAEELAANAAADERNYRHGLTIMPLQEYDPELDRNYRGYWDLYGYSNQILVLDSNTNQIPLTGFYGADNLLEYLYPYGNETSWPGARLQTVDQMPGNLSFFIDYKDDYCFRAGVTPVSGAEARYIVVKALVQEGFESMTMNVWGYDADTHQYEIAQAVLTGKHALGNPGEAQYLVIDMKDVLADCEAVDRLSFHVENMYQEGAIYLMEIAFLSSASEVEGYLPSEGEDSYIELPDEVVVPSLDGLMAYMPMDKTVRNEISSAVVPETVLSPTWEEGYKGAAFSSGGTGHLNLGQNCRPGTSSFSVGMWVKPTTNSGQVCLLSNMCWSTEDTGFVFVWYQHRDTVRCMLNYNGAKQQYNFNVPDDYLDRWMYVVMVVDRENHQVKMSFDFEEFQVYELNSAWSNVSFDSFDEYTSEYRPVAIGNDGDGCRSVPMGNLIDEILIFDHAIDYSELMNIAKYYGGY